MQYIYKLFVKTLLVTVLMSYLAVGIVDRIKVHREHMESLDKELLLEKETNDGPPSEAAIALRRQLREEAGLIVFFYLCVMTLFIWPVTLAVRTGYLVIFKMFAPGAEIVELRNGKDLAMFSSRQLHHRIYATDRFFGVPLRQLSNLPPLNDRGLLAQDNVIFTILDGPNGRGKPRVFANLHRYTSNDRFTLPVAIFLWKPGVIPWHERKGHRLREEYNYYMNINQQVCEENNDLLHN